MAQRGMALVEFAIVVPVLALIFVGLVELGRFAYFSIVVSNAARAGAAYGAQNYTTAGQTGPTGAIAAAAIADGQNNISTITADASDYCACWNGATGTETTPALCTVPPSTCAAGVGVTYVRVTTHGSFSAMFHYAQLPSTFTVNATALMRVHN